MANDKTTSIKKFLAFSLDILGIVLIMGAVSLDLVQNDSGLYEIGTLQMAGIAFGVILTLISSFIIRPSSLSNAIQFTKLPSFAIFVVSTLLLVISLIGLAFPLRNPDVYQGIEYAGKVRTPQYSAEEVYTQMDRIDSIDEQYPEYAKRLTQLIFDGTVHYWEEGLEDNAYNLRIPIYENYLIYFLNLLQGVNGNYEFCKAERAIERSASVCSQSSKILADILGRNRVPAHIVGLEGHVVARARVDKETDQWWILDADYGVVIEHDIDEIETNPILVQQAYEVQGYSQRVIDILVDIYGPGGNSIIDENLQCEGEDHVYLLKWLIPLLGILPFTIFIAIHQIQKEKQQR
ncbi:MAG: hypothetical protein ISS57_18210 [Anaerolineales bacterium]|nr:hypothetical protein [Anaerolineales bacterium]